MNAQDFAYWLNGFAELNGDTPPTEAQWKAIKEHLALVFRKVTPAINLNPSIFPPGTIPLDAKPGWPLPQAPTSGVRQVLPLRAECTC